MSEGLTKSGSQVVPLDVKRPETLDTAAPAIRSTHGSTIDHGGPESGARPAMQMNTTMHLIALADDELCIDCSIRVFRPP